MEQSRRAFQQPAIGGLSSPRKSRKRLRLPILALVVLLSLIAPSAARAQANPNLSNEILFSGTPEFSNVQCNPDGTSSGSFSVTGAATGPFPGAFAETGSFTIGPQSTAVSIPGTVGIATGPLLTFNASFTIFSGDTTITGTKRLMTQVVGGSYGSCTEFSDATLGGGGITGAQGSAIDATTFDHEYQAVISTSAGSFSDAGTASTRASLQQVQASSIGPFEAAVFSEGFLSTGSTPLTTPGRSTGGGKVAPDVTFGFNAHSDERGTKGTCVAVDHVEDIQVRCLDVRSYTQVGTRATFSGRAEVDGVQTSYRIDVDDLGEPGTGKDTFKIQTDSGYSAAGVLTGGNVQVHPK